MFQNTKALVLREVRYKEADRILTVLSDTGGKMTVKARGALRKGSRLTAATQQLTYAEMTLFGNKGKYTVNEASIVEDFAGLRSDISELSLGCYFAECAEAMAVEDQPDAELLQLTLNSLYALSKGLCDSRQIKAAFELRLASIAGYTPDLSGCCVCGKSDPERPILSLTDGKIVCADCRNAAVERPLRLENDTLKAMRYIVNAPPKKLFSFHTEDRCLKELSDAAESYFLIQADRRFASLDYWRKLT